MQHGRPSPYLTIAFPNRPPQDQEYFDLETLSPQARERWKRRAGVVPQVHHLRLPRSGSS